MSVVGIGKDNESDSDGFVAVLLRSIFRNSRLLTWLCSNIPWIRAKNWRGRWGMGGKSFQSRRRIQGKNERRSNS